ncbi:NAD(P)-dependent oxidoreductase [Liquorilactobacillus cacaonum]|uniref:Lactate dehydrogenase related dehydrogenase n=1 Tax=Liquorilactobacillus cacaonum DSM 21116 TaxID=1423729 RepID=A0A0R2CWT1_9LACO|nr:NAD(P)-dependent oxidoreductase [Liquorilactobacillus cacaonum]KRM91955.1 lactate dehydrogenase related dehydrogenase [Liquorilactobacillus cacaonum DSM 21116]
MKIVYVVDPIADDGIKLLEENNFTVFQKNKELSIPASLALCNPNEVIALIIRATKITPAELELFPNLKIIARHGVGVDNLPLEYIKSRQIRLTYTPGLNATSVAELSLTLILNLLKKIPVNHADKFFDGTLLTGKTIGLIGYGKIAQKLSQILKPFDINLLVYNHRQKNLEYGKQVALAQIASESDIISLHIPATNETNNLINSDFLKKMKTSALLINTARGSLIDTDALYLALSAQSIGGAALDVLDSGVKHPIAEVCTLPNVIVTPHIGASSIEVLQQSSIRCAKEILLYEEGNTPIQSFF